MAVWHSPATTAGLRLGVFVYVKVRVSVGLFDKAQDMLEQFLLGLGLLARSTLAAIWSCQMHLVHMEGHRPKDNVHALLDGVLVRINLGDVPGLQDNLGIVEEREFLKVVQVSLEIVVLGASIRNLVKEQLDFGGA